MASNSPTRKPRRSELAAQAPATGLAAKLERAAETGKMPRVVERPPDNKSVASRLFEGKSTVLAIPEPEVEEDEDWEAELPPIDPADLASALGDSLQSRGVTEADVDRLWDWVRADDDKGKAFCGVVPETSKHLRQLLTAFGPHLFALEDSAQEGESHIGLAAVQLFEPNRAAVHLYLAKVARGDARRLLPQLMEMAEGAFPGRTFVIITEDAAAARLYRSIGFKASFLLTWVPKPEPVLEPDSAVLEDDNG